LGQTPPPSQKMATVHVRIVSFVGEDLGSPRIRRFQSLTTGQDLASRFQNGAASNVPFGEYRIDASQTGFSSAQRNVSVYQNEVWVILGLDVGTNDGGPLPVHQVAGSIKNVGSQEPTIWLKLVSIHTGFIANGKVSDDGNFTIAGIPAGVYVLIAVQEAKVRAMKVVSVPTADSISLDLSQGQ